MVALGKNTAIYVGGVDVDSDEYSDKIYQFVADEMRWKKTAKGSFPWRHKWARKVKPTEMIEFPYKFLLMRC